MTHILVDFSNESVKVHFRVVGNVDELEDKEPVVIANKVAKILRNSVETGQIGNLTVKQTFELRGLYCFVHLLIESFVD